MNSTPTILVVDDAAANVELVSSILASEGFHTLAATSGEAAFAAARAGHPDLILLDVVMPGESGFETCARLKSDPATTEIPVIFLSALDDVRNKVTGLKVGGVDYISKPVYGEEVLARVRVHLRIRETNRRLVAEQRARIEELREAQQAILVRPEDCTEAAFAVYYKPLEVVGGDFYDVAAVAPGVFGYLVADVSGHGVSASFLTAAVKALLRQYAGPVFSPEDTLRGVDSIMRQMLGEEQFLTACYARLNRRTGRLSVVGAGHPPLVLVTASGEPRVVESRGDPLGVFGAAVLHRKDVAVAPGDRFYLYSDGFIESEPGAGRKPGMERLVEACVRRRAAPLADAPALIAGDLRPQSGTAADDLVLLAEEERA
jgi:sigma-B regulation protein RsbU (phosphoserine phosphatase)